MTNLEAPFPPADLPLPVFVPPSVTDPVSNLDFLPVDDAFALEMRSGTIEQLVGGDALRRGVSERIEAGRSEANADLVAGRDRVRVQGSLHVHTGHGLAEQAAHLHTTVDGTLDVHAAGEDTVLLAGHMRDRWDGGAAIVAAMTDDTVGGGGVRVTTPLDLWVHGLMGVEERIGTCTADAVLLELGATHYEREYGSGAHAAGLAAYTGSLYLSNRSTFRPLMRVKSGVRNLIAGGGGGGGGGDAGARGAPAASPPPASAAGGAGAQAASETLCAATGAGGAAQAGGMAGVRSQDLAGIHRGDEVAALSGGAHVAGTSGDLTGLRRGEDTAGQLAALRDAMRGGGAGAQGEVTSVSRVPGLDGTASVHEASAADTVGDIRSGATAPDLDAPVLHSTDSPRPLPPGVKLGLLGGADRPPQPAAPESDLPAVFSVLREHRSYFNLSARAYIGSEFQHAIDRVTYRARTVFLDSGATVEDLANCPSDATQAEYYYAVLQKTALQADMENNFGWASAIRLAMKEITDMATEKLHAIRTRYEIDIPLSTQASKRPAGTARPTLKVAAIVPPVLIIDQSNWISFHKQLRSLTRRFSESGPKPVAADFSKAFQHTSQTAYRYFKSAGGYLEEPTRYAYGPTIAQQKYEALVDMLRQAEISDDPTRASELYKILRAIHSLASKDWTRLTEKYGPLDVLSSTMEPSPMQLPPATIVPTASGALPVTIGPPVSVPPTTVPPVERLGILASPLPIALARSPAFPEPAGGLVQTTGVPGPPLASGLPRPSLAKAGDLGRWRLDPTTTATTAAQPVAIETIVTPSLAETSPFRLQPADPLPVPDTVSFEFELHHAGETMRSPFVTTALPELELGEVIQILGTGEGISHPAPLPPPSAAGRAGAGARAPPPIADPWGIRPQGMGGEPHSVAFDLWSAPPGPGSQVAYTDAAGTAVLSLGAPPGWQGAATPGFGHAASGAVELPPSRREAIALRFGTEVALRQAEVALHTHHVEALGGFAPQWPVVLADVRWIHAVTRWDSATDAASFEANWRALEALARFLQLPLPAP